MADLDPVSLVTDRLVLQPLDSGLARQITAGQQIDVPAGRGWPTADDVAIASLVTATSDGGVFLIRRRDGAGGRPGVAIGSCGLKGRPDARGDAEIGYGLAPAFHGHGYGTEAVGVLVRWVLAQPGVQRVIAEVRTDNAPSRRLVERLGFIEFSAADPFVYYARSG